jgi:lipid-A-disaccharide synthase-like uncharacterized protein
MTVFLNGYLFYVLAQTTLPIDPEGFMPFQHNYKLWKAIGFLGLVCFQSRWVTQWLYSEKHGESRIPVSFWWQSLAGAILCLLYFLRQQDSIGILGYCFTVIPCARNIMLIKKKERRLAEEKARGFDVQPDK